MLLQVVTDLDFDYIISMAHPNNISGCKTLEKFVLNLLKRQIYQWVI